MPVRSDYGDLTSMLQAIISPLVTKLQTLEDKVDRLSAERVTRTDFENLRKEISGSYVPRDAYEPRHLAIVERQATLETTIRETRKELEERMSQQTAMQLSLKERNWLRLSQVAGFLGFAGALLEWLFQHIKLQ